MPDTLRLASNHHNRTENGGPSLGFSKLTGMLMLHGVQTRCGAENTATRLFFPATRNLFRTTHLHRCVHAPAVPPGHRCDVFGGVYI